MKTLQATLEGTLIPPPQPMTVLLTDAPSGPQISRGMKLMYLRKEEEEKRKNASLYGFVDRRD